MRLDNELDNKSHDLLFNGALILLIRVTLIEENEEA